MAVCTALISLPAEVILMIAQSLGCADLLRFRQVSTRIYTITTTYSNTLVAAILKEQFRLEQKLFRPGPTESVHHHDQNLRLAAATMMTRHEHLAPGHLIPRLVYLTQRIIEELQTARAIRSDSTVQLTRTQRLDIILHRILNISLTEGKLGIHFGEENCQTKRVDYLYDYQSLKSEAVVHPYLDEWECPLRVERWRERCSMLMKRSYTYLAFLQHLSGKMQVAAHNILRYVTYADALSYHPDFLLVTMWVYRQNLEIYDQVHPQLLRDESIGPDHVLSPRSIPWARSAPIFARMMIVEFSRIVNRIVHRSGWYETGDTRHINECAEDLHLMRVRQFQRSRWSDESAWRARWVDGA